MNESAFFLPRCQAVLMIKSPSPHIRAGGLPVIWASVGREKEVCKAVAEHQQTQSISSLSMPHLSVSFLPALSLLSRGSLPNADLVARSTPGSSGLGLCPSLEPELRHPQLWHCSVLCAQPGSRKYLFISCACDTVVAVLDLSLSSQMYPNTSPLNSLHVASPREK